MTFRSFLKLIFQGQRTARAGLGFADMTRGIIENHQQLGIQTVSESTILFRNSEISVEEYERLKRKLIRLANRRLKTYNIPMIPGNWEEND